jgi:hypothetical protein
VTDSNVFQLSQPGTLSDPLTEVLRSGARALLAQAVAAEVAGFLEGHADKLTDDGRQRLVRHGHLPEREIMTGIGPVAVRAPRIRDRVGTGEERIAFSSAILPPYARRSKSLEVLISSSRQFPNRRQGSPRVVRTKTAAPAICERRGREQSRSSGTRPTGAFGSNLAARTAGIGASLPLYGSPKISGHKFALTKAPAR